MKEASFKGYAAFGKGEALKVLEFDPGPIQADRVEVAVEYCGICHSDLSMLENDWGMTQYPIVPGHEIIGTVVAMGPQAKKLRIGQRVGIGWISGSCMECKQCLSGDQNFCPNGEGTIVQRPGGFATRVRAQWPWAIPLPEALDPAKCGPLFCGGVTVFNPILQAGVKSTDRVGVIGIGGLGHMALMFLRAWGCEVFAFTSSESKREEAKRLGAHHVVNSRNAAEMEKVKSALDFVLVTVNVRLDWSAVLATLAPRGWLHFVGAVLEPVPVEVFSLIGTGRIISGSPTGTPVAVAEMLDFCARHKIEPIVESFPMSKVNDALQHLRDGKARYRVVLKNDF